MPLFPFRSRGRKDAFVRKPANPTGDQSHHPPVSQLNLDRQVDGNSTRLNGKPTTPTPISPHIEQAGHLITTPAQLGRANPMTLKVFWERSWKTISISFSLQLVALSAAVGHYLLHRQLDGMFADNGNLKQSHVSTASLLLGALFKATLTASVGLSFAQHLWHVLRGHLISARTIEQLFLLRNNIFIMGNFANIRHAPILYSMAIYIWCIGIAMVYPPGSLTVGLGILSETTPHNLSVMMPTPSLNVPLIPKTPKREYLHDIAPSLSIVAISGRSRLEQERYNKYSNDSTLKPFRDLSYSGPVWALSQLARSALRRSPIPILGNSPGENSSYLLQFIAPEYTCTTKTTNRTITKKFMWEKSNITGRSEGFTFPMFRISSSISTGKLNISKIYLAKSLTSKQEFNDNGTSKQEFEDNDTPEQEFEDDDTSEQEFDDDDTSKQEFKDNDTSKQEFKDNGTSRIGLEMNITFRTVSLLCQPVLVNYNLSISYPRGIQKLDLSKGSKTLLKSSRRYLENEHIWPDNEDWSLLNVSSYPEGLSSFLRSSIKLLPTFDQLSILESLAKNMRHNWRVQLEIIPALCIFKPPTPDTDYCLPTFSGYREEGELSLLEDSVFHSKVDPGVGPSTKGPVIYDPRDLNFTEDVLNTLLSNITISALTFNTWKSLVPVNKTEYRSVYKFSHPQNLIIPYSICFSIGTIFILVGMYCIWCNGAPVADGGFLQIMQATRGDTEMERLVLQNGSMNADDIPQELKNLKLRYGELIIGEERGRQSKVFGMGTAAETISWKRRHHRRSSYEGEHEHVA